MIIVGYYLYKQKRYTASNALITLNEIAHLGDNTLIFVEGENTILGKTYSLTCGFVNSITFERLFHNPVGYVIE